MSMKIELYDFSKYDKKFSKTGGKYGFKTTYTKTGNRWEIEHETTSTHPFCRRCGRFIDHYNKETDTYICGRGLIKITTTELDYRLFKFMDIHKNKHDGFIGLQDDDNSDKPIEPIEEIELTEVEEDE